MQSKIKYVTVLCILVSTINTIACNSQIISNMDVNFKDAYAQISITLINSSADTLVLPMTTVFLGINKSAKESLMGFPPLKCFFTRISIFPNTVSSLNYYSDDYEVFDLNKFPELLLIYPQDSTTVVWHLKMKSKYLLQKRSKYKIEVEIPYWTYTEFQDIQKLFLKHKFKDYFLDKSENYLFKPSSFDSDGMNLFVYRYPNINIQLGNYSAISSVIEKSKNRIIVNQIIKY